MAKILISYRRLDASSIAARLYEILASHYGAEQVGIDYAHAQAGEDFTRHVHEAIESCETFLVLIGPDWRGPRHGEKLAIENNYDPVRWEVATALRLRKMVIPILVEGASMPAPQELPDDIRNLSYQNCLELRSHGFRADTERLIRSIHAQDSIKRHRALLKSPETPEGDLRDNLQPTEARSTITGQARLLLSYRRSDTGQIAGRLFDRLRDRFGSDKVYMDIDSVPYGINFRRHIEKALEACKVLVVLMGPKWIGPRLLRRPRIFDRDDPVRIELQIALKKNVPIFPVLVDDAKMPSIHQLPTDLRHFGDINAAPLNSGRDFDQHVSKLLVALDSIVVSKG